MNILRRLPGVPRTQTGLTDVQLPQDQEKRQQWAFEENRRLREANARIPRLDGEITRLKRERKEWIAQKTNLEQDHQMFRMENKNLRASAETAERKWVEAKKHSERVDSDNSELRKRLQEEEKQVRELKQKLGINNSKLVNPSDAGNNLTSISNSDGISRPATNSFMQRVMQTKQRLSINVNEKLGARSRPPEKVVSFAVFKERTESMYQANLSLQKEIEKFKAKHDEMENKLKSSLGENSGIKQTNRDMEQQVMDLRCKLNTISASLRGRSGELECVREEKDRQAKELERVKQELESALAGIFLVRDEVAQEKNRNKAGAEELDRLFRTNRQLENDINNLRSTTKSQKAELESTRNTIKSLNTELKTTRRHLVEMQAKEKNAVSRAQGLSKQLELTQCDLQTMREQNKSLFLEEGEREQLLKELERMEGVNARLLSKFKESERKSAEAATRYEGELQEALECTQEVIDQITEELRVSKELNTKLQMENDNLKKEKAAFETEIVRIKQENGKLVDLAKSSEPPQKRTDDDKENKMSWQNTQKSTTLADKDAADNLKAQRLKLPDDSKNDSEREDVKIENLKSKLLPTELVNTNMPADTYLKDKMSSKITESSDMVRKLD